MELSRQSYLHWQRGVHEHGYSGYFLSGMLCYMECYARFYLTPPDVVLQAAQLPPTGDGQDGSFCGSPCHLVVSS